MALISQNGNSNITHQWSHHTQDKKTLKVEYKKPFMKSHDFMLKSHVTFYYINLASSINFFLTFCFLPPSSTNTTTGYINNYGIYQSPISLYHLCIACLHVQHCFYSNIFIFLVTTPAMGCLGAAYMVTSWCNYACFSVGKPWF